MASDSHKSGGQTSGDLSRPLVAAPPTGGKPAAPSPVVVRATEEAPARAAAVLVHAPPASPPSIESLDSELANMTEQMLASEESTGLPGAPAGSAAPKHKSHPPAPAQPATGAAPATPAHPAPVAPAPAQRIHFGPALRVRAEQAALATLARASAPVLKRSPSFRRSLGWVAINTFFLAACLWAYALFFRSPHPAEAGNAPFDFATSGLPGALVREPEETHGATGEQAAGHGAKQPSPQESGHGGAKGLKTAPKPLLDGAQRFIVNDSMPSFKTDAKPKKDAGGGGGH